MNTDERLLPLLSEAIILAENAHDGQLDKAGRRYFPHPLRVMEACAEFGIDYMICGVLHDVVEDTTVTLDAIETRFGAGIALTVDRLSHREGQSLDEYMDRILPERRASIVKLADLHDNSSPHRRVPGAKWQANLNDRYAAQREQILAVHSISGMAVR